MAAILALATPHFRHESNTLNPFLLLWSLLSLTRVDIGRRANAVFDKVQF